MAQIVVIFQRLHQVDNAGRHIALRKTLLTALTTALATGKLVVGMY